MPPQPPAFLAACSPLHARLYALWEAKRGDRTMPARADFAIDELKPWLGWLVLYDVLPAALPDGHDFAYRLFGTRVVDGVPGELTAGRVSQAAITADRSFALETLRTVCRTRAPSYRNDLAICADGVSYTPERLFLPLSSGAPEVEMIVMYGSQYRDAKGNAIRPANSGIF
ncbi:MAG: PAS domain-containing protein [Alphaproteobacteria bacterium]|nr:PAS domain-containing protein [Alphaproteobacteria bacterium]